MARKDVLLKDRANNILDPETNIGQIKDSAGDTILSANPTTKRVSGVNSYKIDADALISYPTLSDFPASGEDGKIYLAQDTNYMYRWSTSSYVQIGGGQAPVTSVNSKTGAVVLEISDIINAQHKLSSDLVDDAGNTNKFVTQSEKTLWNSKVNAYEVADITVLTTAQVNTLKNGDVVVENDNGAKKSYIVSNKDSNILYLIYVNNDLVTKVSYKYENNAWAYDTSETTNITTEVSREERFGNNWVTKTWSSGVIYLYGEYIWTDGENIYYSYSSTQKQLVNGAWVDKVWSGLTDFDAYYIWSDGENIYYSYGEDGLQYILNKATSTWSAKTWSGITGINYMLSGLFIWSDGTNIYYSNADDDWQYILNKATGNWEVKTWSGFTNIDGQYIWKDNDNNIYYSNGSNQYYLDGNEWKTKTWTGLTNFGGKKVWSDGENIYYSNGSDQYVLDKSTTTWSAKTWTGLTSFGGSNIWQDNDGNIYNSNGGTHYQLQKETIIHKGDLDDVKAEVDGIKNGETLDSFADVEEALENAGGGGVKIIEVSDVTAIANATIDTIRNGDMVVENENGNKSIYIASYKESETALYLVKVDDGKLKTVLYNYANNVWSYVSTDTIYLTGTFSTAKVFRDKTWHGNVANTFGGLYIWSDGENVYYSSGSNYQYVLNKETSTWELKTWNGFTNIFGYNIWSDGENIYYSSYNFTPPSGQTSSNYQYVLNKETSTWELKTWNGFDTISASYIWSDGTNIYFSVNLTLSPYTTYQYVLDKATSTWEETGWTGQMHLINGCNVWTDGTNIYYTYGASNYIWDSSTSSFVGLSIPGEKPNKMSDEPYLPYYKYVWSDGTNTYYSRSSGEQFIFDKKNKKWNRQDLFGVSSISGYNIWSDGENIYYSGGQIQKILTSVCDVKDVANLVETKQRTLVSGKTIKTVGGETLLGEGDIAIPKLTEYLELSSSATSGTITAEELSAILYKIIKRDNLIYTFSNRETGVQVIGSTDQTEYVSGLTYMATADFQTWYSVASSRQFKTYLGRGYHIRIADTNGSINTFLNATYDSTNGVYVIKKITINSAGDWAYSEEADVYAKTQVDTLLNGKQPTLVSGTNIKTINNQSLLGSGDIAIVTSVNGQTGAVTIAVPTQKYLHKCHLYRRTTNTTNESSMSIFFDVISFDSTAYTDSSLALGGAINGKGTTPSEVTDGQIEISIQGWYVPPGAKQMMIMTRTVIGGFLSGNSWNIFTNDWYGILIGNYTGGNAKADTFVSVFGYSPNTITFEDMAVIPL